MPLHQLQLIIISLKCLIIIRFVPVTDFVTDVFFEKMQPLRVTL